MPACYLNVILVTVLKSVPVDGTFFASRFFPELQCHFDWEFTKVYTFETAQYCLITRETSATEITHVADCPLW